MKKNILLLLCTLSLLFGSVTFAEEKLKNIDGFLGLKWGSSKQQVMVLMKNRPNTTIALEKTNMASFKSTFLEKPARIVFYLHENKLWQAYVFIEYSESEIIDKWRELCNDISKKYDVSPDTFYYFKNPYSEGDGFETQALRLGKGSAVTFWKFDQPDGKPSNFLSCEINRFMEIEIGYQNGEMAEEAVANNKKERTKEL